MIYNATLLRIDSPAAADVAGRVTWTAGVEFACRCFVNQQLAKDKYSTGAAMGGVAQQEVSVTAQVLTRDLAPALARAGIDPATTIRTEQRLRIAIDDGPTVLYRVRQAVLQPRGSQTAVTATLEAD